MDFPHIGKSELPHVRQKLTQEIFGLEAARAGLREINETADHRRAQKARIDSEVARYKDIAENASSHSQRRAATDQVEALVHSHWEAEQAMAAALAGAAKAADHVSSYDYLATVNSWLGEHRLARLHAGAEPLVRVIPPKVGKVASFPDEVAKSRAQIAAKAEQIGQTDLAPALASDLWAAIMADLDRRVERGKPDFDPRRRDRSPVDLGRMLGEHHIGDTLAWLHRDAIADRLCQLIGTQDAPGALSDADRQRTIAKLQAEKLALERYEEALICAAETIGQRIPRRRNADPRAILEVE